jgi:hypothetical protein
MYLSNINHIVLIYNLKLMILINKNMSQVYNIKVIYFRKIHLELHNKDLYKVIFIKKQLGFKVILIIIIYIKIKTPQ